MERNEPTHSAAERAAEWVTELRSQYGDHRSLAAAMTALGVPIKHGTLSRIEAGRQEVTVEEFLLLAMLSDGLGQLPVRPIRLGALEIRDVDEITGRSRKSSAADHARHTAMEAAGRSQERQLAAVLEVEPAEVTAAVHELYGRGMAEEITYRATDRNMRSSDDYALPGSAVWQAYRMHAVRTVRREIADHLEEN